MSGMTLAKRVAALGIAGLAVAGTVAPTVAQTYVVPERSQIYTWNSPAYGGSPVYGGYVYSQRVMPQWNSGLSGTECWTDEGYGRRSSCDTGR